MPSYSVKQKQAIIRQLLQPNALCASALSKKIGISQGTLSRWLQEHKKHGEVPMNKRPLDWTPEERFNAVVSTNTMTDAEIGEYVRKNGILRLQLEDWKADILQSLGNKLGRKPDPEKRDLKRQIKSLEKDLNNKNKALAEAAALLVLKKKAHSLWGGDEES